MTIVMMNNHKDTSLFFNIIFHICIPILGTISILYIVSFWISGDTYITKPILPVMSLLIAIFYFCMKAFITIKSMKVHKNIKMNYLGMIILIAIISLIISIITLVISETILSQISDILSVLAIVFTISVDLFISIVVKRINKVNEI